MMSNVAQLSGGPAGYSGPSVHEKTLNERVQFACALIEESNSRLSRQLQRTGLMPQETNALPPATGNAPPDPVAMLTENVCRLENAVAACGALSELADRIA